MLSCALNRRSADSVDYYGYRDEEDGVLLAAEEDAENIARVRAHEEWLAGKGADKSVAADDDQEFYKQESYDHGVRLPASFLERSRSLEKIACVNAIGCARKNPHGVDGSGR